MYGFGFGKRLSLSVLSVGIDMRGYTEMLYRDYIHRLVQLRAGLTHSREEEEEEEVIMSFAYDF